MTVWAWITATAASPAYLSNIVTGLIIFNYPDYEPKRWHGTLIMWGFVILPVAWNFYFRRALNTMEMIGGVCHVVFFIISVIVLVVLARRSDSSFVFNTLTHDISGWTNPVVAWGVGLLTVTFPITAFDGVLHMSDEVKGPERRVPRSMITAVTLNSIMQFAFMITLMFCIGDVDRVTNSPTGLPIIEVYYQATKSKPGTNILVVFTALILFISLFNIFASVSRLTWCFAKDKGLPFSSYFAYVSQDQADIRKWLTVFKIHPRLNIPLNALLLVGFVCILLSLINIGSSTAFNALISLPLISLYWSYFIPILFIAIRKIQGRHPNYGPFKLGKWGLPINILSCIYILWIECFVGLPTVLPVTGSTMNYAAPILGGIVVIIFVDWFSTGRKRFTMPVSKAVKEADY